MPKETKRKSVTRDVKKAMPRRKATKACGLCGKTRKLTKTECCDNWICDDYDKYVMFSYATNSCNRNHDRYTICSRHHIEGHDGKWQDCEKCKKDYHIAHYVDMATNGFNFEKLENAPKVTITCSNCGFQSETLNDFPITLMKGGKTDFICKKNKCQKKHS